ncbi:DUF1616 domain-containing protein [Halococcus saccharolyticus]|uniref:DUF1616 domain-containing protein n=1 Tax=Halococcus saccharolyticus DSM 5350 TaxID=1227455 RepID=M0MJ95_9EURY|nr:hypothetical protein C449_09104 [Halococcus saccharolyticus DSM 5350]
MNDDHKRLLTQVLLAVLVVSVLAIVYFSFTPEQRTDPYTEFYVLGPEGNASNYSDNLSVGENRDLTVGISNHENREMQYTLVLELDNETLNTRTVSIADQETWERNRSFTPESSGRKQLQLLLYRGESVTPELEPYRTLRLWMTVQEASTANNRQIPDSRTSGHHNE